jgi:methylenetetrahydrofolate reductase (NADPH)
MDHALPEVPPQGTLQRWLTGPRFGGLPNFAELPPPKLSFEFFPPKTDALEAQLWSCIRRLEPLCPCFVSVTYGAGGTTQARTHATVARIVKETSLTPAAHLTCVGASRAERYEAHPEGYAYAADLVAGLARIAPFEISVAAYPETHPTALSHDHDLDNLKRKIDAGATRAITQYFFDSEVYLRFLDRCAAAGITLPIVPGIMPVSNFNQMKKFSAMCGAGVPGWMGRLFEGLDDDPETRRMVSVVLAAEQVRLLQANGVDEFHFYTLNRPDLVYAIAHILGARPQPVTPP